MPFDVYVLDVFWRMSGRKELRSPANPRVGLREPLTIDWKESWSQSLEQVGTQGREGGERVIIQNTSEVELGEVRASYKRSRKRSGHASEKSRIADHDSHLIH
jgi:hypothetical protein